MDKSKIEDQVKQMVGQSVKQTLSTRQDIFTEGFVNSFEATQLTLQIEKTFRVKISDAEAGNLHTVEAIALLIIKKTG